MAFPTLIFTKLANTQHGFVWISYTFSPKMENKRGKY